MTPLNKIGGFVLFRLSQPYSVIEPHSVIATAFGYQKCLRKKVPEADFKIPFKGFKNKVDKIEEEEEEEEEEIEEEEGEEEQQREAVIQQIIDKLEMRELPLSGLKNF